MSMLTKMLNYNRFINKYKSRISDIPSLDAVAKQYVVNRKDFNFYDDKVAYAFMTSLAEVPDETFEFPSATIRKTLPKDGAIYTDYSNHSFVQFNNKHKVRTPNEEQCKLWVNTSLGHVGEVALLLAEFINKSYEKSTTKNKNLTTFFKTTYNKQRNDTITIYTTYKEADAIVSFLVKLKQEHEELFDAEVLANPLVMKIDEFISYADVAHCVSFPLSIADMFVYVNEHKGFDELSTGEQIAYAKSLMIDYMLHMLKTGRCNDDLLVNIKNLGIRRINGKNASQLTKKEILVLSKELSEEKEKIIQQTKINL